MKYTLTTKHHTGKPTEFGDAEQFHSRVDLRESIRLDMLPRCPRVGPHLDYSFHNVMSKLDKLIESGEDFELHAMAAVYRVVAEPSGPLWGVRYANPQPGFAGSVTITDSFDAAVEYVNWSITSELDYRDSFTEAGEEPLDRSEYHDAMRTLYTHAAAKQAGSVHCWGGTYYIEVVA